MTEGQSVRAASAPQGGADAGAAHVQGPVPGPNAEATDGTSPAATQGTEAAEAHIRVDARKLESALLGLRHEVVEVSLVLRAPGVEEARSERRKILSQIDDYLLPRLRQSEAPILVALVGSTGAGKSTLMNSLVGMQVSQTGVRRPTTNSPVLACHPSDARWFAENVFLPTLPRVRQQGLAMPGRDGLLVLAASEGMPKGVALLDTPDIDSVVQAHREFAHQFLDASDLWLFMTSSSRYADAAVWDLLQQARDRGAALAIVLSRVPAESARQLTSHFDAMLEANGIRQARRFMIAETVVSDGMLPPEIFAPVRYWLEETAVLQERRIAVLTQTMSGVLDTFRSRVPALAAHVAAQLALHAELLSCVAGAYAAGLAEIDEATRNGSLLRGEILARWQELAGAGDLLRMLQIRKGGRAPGRRGRRRIPARAKALKAALRAGLETMVASVADRAAEDAVDRWQRHSAGAALLEDLSAGAAGSGDEPQFAVAAGLDFTAAANGRRPALAGLAGAATLARSSPDLATRLARAISAWQDHLIHEVQAESVARRSVGRAVSFDDELLALVLTVGLLGHSADDVAAADGATAVPQRLLASLFGAGLLRDLGARARLDLHDRVSLLFEEEMQRFTELVDAVGMPEDTASAKLHQAADALDSARTTDGAA